MADRKFRFGVVAGLAPSAEGWAGTARLAEELGYSTLLVPDTCSTFEPFAALAAAATATTALRVGTFVLPAPFYPPSELAWRAISLDILSGGRFELGLGAGRPGAEAEVVYRERPFGAAAERVRQLAGALRMVKEDFTVAGGRNPMFQPVQKPHPPVLVAAAGRRTFALAAQWADIVTLGVPPETDEEGLAAKVGELRAVAGGEFDRLELALNLAGVGEEFPEYLSKQMGLDPRALAAAGATSILTGTPDQMADTLRRRRDRLGISYVSVNADFMRKLAPVVELLSGS